MPTFELPGMGEMVIYYPPHGNVQKEPCPAMVLRSWYSADADVPMAVLRVFSEGVGDTTVRGVPRSLVVAPCVWMTRDEYRAQKKEAAPAN